MSRVRCFGTSMLSTTLITLILRRALTLAILLISGLVNGPKLILAQNSLEASGRVTPSTSPADFYSGANRGAGLFSTNAIPAISGAGLGIRAFGQPQAPFTAVTRGLVLKPAASSRWLPEPSKPRVDTSWFGGSMASSIGFTGIGHQRGGGFDQFAGRGLGGPQMNFPSLHPGTRILLRNQADGTASGTLPMFDARITSSFSLPFNFAVGAFRPSYREMLGDGRYATSGSFGADRGSAMFGASNLGNGVFLSAGTSYSRRSIAGAAAGNSMAGGQKHLGPSVGLRLTF